jgi:peptidoglycan/xylan/chitin deacetylase (PgdA/CDA1 family)
VVAITIDDLPATPPASVASWDSLTARLLGALARHAAPAVGFVNETKLYADGVLDPSRVALLDAWLAAGHELGNHTFAHRGAHTVPLAQYLAGIAQGEVVTRALARRVGRPLRWFRHPQLHTGRTLAYRQGVERFLAERGYAVAPVTVDNQEWVYARAYAIARERGDAALAARVVAGYFAHLDSAFAYSERLSVTLFGRDIPLVLLLHANELNADHLDAVLTRLAGRGYRFAPLAAALADPAYRSPDAYTGPTGPSWLVRWAHARGLAAPPEPREHRWVAELVAAHGR